MLQKIAAESPGKLIRILYYSRANITGSTTDIASAYVGILATAQKNNSRVGITGALMVSGGRFAQILEGPAVAVRNTFERIKLDPRHRYPTILKVEPVEGRMFGAWAMGLAGTCPGESVPLSAAASLDHAVTNPTDASDTLIALLLNLVQTSETPIVAQDH
jgi:hypothetical protein